MSCKQCAARHDATPKTEPNDQLPADNSMPSSLPSTQDKDNYSQILSPFKNFYRMKNVNDILDDAQVPKSKQLLLLRQLWDVVKSQNPMLSENFNLVICPNANGELEIDILPKPTLNPLPKTRLPEKPWKNK